MYLCMRVFDEYDLSQRNYILKSLLLRFYNDIEKVEITQFLSRSWYFRVIWYATPNPSTPFAVECSKAPQSFFA